MCENMAVFEVCAVSEVLCLVSDGSCVSLLLTMQKRIHIYYSPWDSPCGNTQHARWHTCAHICVPTGMCGPGARSTAWSTICLTSSNHLDRHGFKSW
jgi:hypothetical protein